MHLLCEASAFLAKQAMSFKKKDKIYVEVIGEHLLDKSMKVSYKDFMLNNHIPKKRYTNL